MIIKVAIPLPVPKLFDYAVPEPFRSQLKPGMRVQVPFGKGDKVGLAIEWAEHSPLKTLKEIGQVLDTEAIVPEKLLGMILWAADYYLTAPGEALKAALPALLWKPPRNRRPATPVEHPQAFSEHPVHQLTEAQKAAFGEVYQHLRSAGSWRVERRVAQGVPLAARPPEADRRPDKGTPRRQDPAPVFLLHGITGSGKTEIYLELARHILQEGGQVLVLVPEISLTPQLTGRFQGQVPETIGTYHSGLTPRQREEVWEKALGGELRLVIGTRSAVFLPLKNLKLIIVDEEHDSSFKQEERFRYHARDLTIVRGRDEGIPVVLGSATPSMESYHHSQEGKYRYLHLPDRPVGGSLPDVRFVDLKCEPLSQTQGNSSLISEELATALDQTLRRSEQSLLFLNRRGFSPVQVCLDCGENLQCPNCHISLTLHKGKRQIICHYCLYEQKEAPRCKSCDSTRVAWIGTGTERIEEELTLRFPRATIGRLDRDTTRRRGELTKILSQMKRREIDILVGTQILTKGHDYPDVTLVGVLLAESSLSFPDLRAAERTFQLITQVAGRAGRGKRPGQVLVQGYNPNHYSLRFALEQDFEGFSSQELKYRRELGYPPYQRLIQLVFFSQVQNQVRERAARAADYLRQALGTLATVLGPAPCPLEKLRGKYRWQVLIKARNYRSLKGRLQTILDADFKSILASQVKCAVDVDPITML